MANNVKNTIIFPKPVESGILRHSSDLVEKDTIDFEALVPVPTDCNDWYMYRYQHWGVKWNASECERLEGFVEAYSFITPWCCPRAWLETLAKKTDYLLFYSEEGHFDCGWAQAINGELIDHEFSPGTKEFDIFHLWHHYDTRTTRQYIENYMVECEKEECEFPNFKEDIDVILKKIEEKSGYLFREKLTGEDNETQTN